MATKCVDVLSRLEKGYYESKIEIPKGQHKPVILNCTVDELTSAELQSLPDVKKRYEENIAFCRQKVEERRKDQRQLNEVFKKDCAEGLGIDINTKLGQKLVELAWNEGHSGGLREVYSYMTDMAEIWEAAVETFGKNKS